MAEVMAGISIIKAVGTLTVFFFIGHNVPMRTKLPVFLQVEICELADVPVLHEFILFRGQTFYPDRVIRPTFQKLRQRLVDFGLDPDTLLHVGVPELVDGQLVSYDCCIEFPLPESLENVKTLPGGHYAVLSVEKSPSKIRSAVRAFCGDYLPDHGLIPDDARPIYEIYFKDTLEYCVPIR
jgi:DNA gyrase inhibitor GyrI